MPPRIRTPLNGAELPSQPVLVGRQFHPFFCIIVTRRSVSRSHGWQVLMTLTQQEKGGISGKMRIAAFLQSVDPGYFEVGSTGRVGFLDGDFRLDHGKKKGSLFKDIHGVVSRGASYVGLVVEHLCCVYDVFKEFILPPKCWARTNFVFFSMIFGGC